MSKQTKTTLIIIFSFLAIFITGSMITVLTAGEQSRVIMFHASRVELVNTQEIDMKGISKLDILYEHSGMSVEFYEGNSDKLIIKEYMVEDAKDDEFAVISTGLDGKLSIQGGEKKAVIVFAGTIIGNERIEVYLPKDYQGAIKAKTSSGDIKGHDPIVSSQQVSFQASSGNITFSKVEATEIEVHTSSGRIRMEYAHAIVSRNFTASSGDIKVQGGSGNSKFTTSSGKIQAEGIIGDVEAIATSGDITLTEIQGSVHVETSSGRITLKKVQGNTHVKSTSGDISLEGVQGDIEAKASSGRVKVSDLEGAVTIQTTSGDIQIEIKQMTGDVKLSASSGRVTLRLPKEVAFEFRADTNSGDIRTNFGDDLSYNKKGNSAYGSVGREPIYEVEITTTSGNIVVK